MCDRTVADPARAEHALAAMIDLGAAEPFVLLAGSTVTSTGESRIIGDVGVSPGTEIVGFPPATVQDGALHSADGPAAAAQGDLTTAYNDAAGQPCDTVLTDQDLGGMTLAPGVYCFATSALLTGILTLDGVGDENAVFVFQIGSTLTTASDSAVNMIGNALAGRVFWQVGSSATLGTGTAFSGNILAQASITATTNATIAGRALARDGAVTIDTMIGEAVPTEPEIIVPGLDSGVPDSGLDAGELDGGALDAGGDGDADADSDTDADADADVADQGGISGGAMHCSAPSTPGTGGGAGAALVLFGLFGATALRRRRGLLALLGVVASMLPGAAQADESVTLDQFHPAETAEDGIAISRPIALDHHRFSAMATLEYAHNPLVYEVVAGDSDTQLEESIVDHQLTLHMGAAFGLVDRIIVFAGISGSLVQVGVGRPGYVEADGTRLGDVLLGGRALLVGESRLGKGPYGALALQVGVTLPVAHWTSPTSQLTGESSVMVTPELLAEVGGRRLRVTANLGARVRPVEKFKTFSVGSELTWALGVGVPLVRELELDVEAYGATAVSSNFMDRNSTPFEAIGGLRWRGASGWTAALGAGPGLVRGYGSPDFRAVTSLGWAQPTPPPIVREVPLPTPPPVVQEVAPPPPSPPADWDGDGIVDSLDRCPRVPGPADNDGCALYVRLEPSETAPVEIVIVQRIEFDTSDSVLLPASDAVLEEIRAVLEVNPQLLRIAIEGHADERDTDEHNMALSQRRANAVMRWLTEHGVAADRLVARGYGEHEPFAAGTTPSAQQTNRNVQFFILEPAATNPAR